jgi:hypothetical protein
MIKNNLINELIFATALCVLSSCGGSTNVAEQPPQQSQQPTTAILTLSTVVTGTIPATTTINSYVITVTLPAGVTVKTIANSSATSAGVLVSSGMASGALVSGIYTAASGTVPGKVSVLIASAIGFDAGECCKVNCDIAVGYYTKASDFVLPTLNDATGMDVSVSTVTLTKELTLSASAVVQ